MLTENSYVSERGKMTTVRVKVNDYKFEEDRHTAALPGQQQQAEDDIIFQENGSVVCVVAGNRKVPVRVPQSVALAAARLARHRNLNRKVRVKTQR